jgi:hypothetical protein
MRSMDVAFADIPSIPGLDARETAATVWAALILGYVAVKSSGFRSSVLSLLKLIFGSILAGLLAVAAVYMTGVVWLLQVIGYWDCRMAKTTVFWFVGTGLVTAFSTKQKDGRYFFRLVVRNFSTAAIVAYFMNIHRFPLYVWLALFPIVLLLVGSQALAEVDTQYAAAKKPSDTLLTVIALAALAFSLAYVVGHFSTLTTGETGKEFFLPFVLTVCFIPLLYAMALFIVYQGMLGMIRFRFAENVHLYRFARKEIIRACGVSLRRAQLFEEGAFQKRTELRKSLTPPAAVRMSSAALRTPPRTILNSALPHRPLISLRLGSSARARATATAPRISGAVVAFESHPFHSPMKRARGPSAASARRTATNGHRRPWRFGVRPAAGMARRSIPWTSANAAFDLRVTPAARSLHVEAACQIPPAVVRG